MLCEVTIAGETVGYVANKDEFENKVNEIINKEEESKLFTTIENMPEYHLKLVNKSEQTNEDVILGKLEAKAETTYKLYAVTIDGKEKAIIASLDEAEKIVDDIEHLYKEHFPLKPFYYSITMGWDNSARRTDGYTIYYNYSLESYYKWLKIIIRETRRRNDEDHRFIFVNAWNEWAEGTYLEPDEKYGYANINTLSKAICDLPLDKKDAKKNKI